MIQSSTETQTEMMIGEEYAVELTRTGRGLIAEVKDTHHPMNGTYALDSTRNCALASLRAKVEEKQSH